MENSQCPEILCGLTKGFFTQRGLFDEMRNIKKCSAKKKQTGSCDSENNSEDLLTLFSTPQIFGSIVEKGIFQCGNCHLTKNLPMEVKNLNNQKCLKKPIE